MVNITEWDPQTVLLADENVDEAWKICVLQGIYFGDNEYTGHLGARISSIFVIGFVSTFFTMLPLFTKHHAKLRMPLYVYIFARYFGTGVIVATAFIHLLDPAYEEIGSLSCVGNTGNWAIYSWCPAIVLLSVVIIFLVDVISDVVVERKFGIRKNHISSNEVMDSVIRNRGADVYSHEPYSVDGTEDVDVEVKGDEKVENSSVSDRLSELEAQKSFRSQISAFLILEFGVIFHSVMIGLNLGAVGDEFKTLYIVLVFHQSFEGLGIGARLSVIQWPEKLSYVWAYMLCLAYGLVTPISISIGLGVRTTYVSGSYNANIISGILDAISAGILIYTGLVELLARDFIFDDKSDRSLAQLFVSLVCVLFGSGIMALLGKWA
jgi:zinc transporter 1/2/3